jgi:hypothetical protein
VDQVLGFGRRRSQPVGEAEQRVAKGLLQRLKRRFITAANFFD